MDRLHRPELTACRPSVNPRKKRAGRSAHTYVEPLPPKSSSDAGSFADRRLMHAHDLRVDRDILRPSGNGGPAVTSCAGSLIEP